MQFSSHFDSGEFERNGRGLPNTIPENLYPIFKQFCEEILEPIRAKFGVMLITSGYRNPELNAAVGGVNSSQHQANENRCAADFRIKDVPIQEVFDWIRLESGLPFDQVILERGKLERHENDDCIHISFVPAFARRMAMTGGTHGSEPYQKVDVA